MQANTKRNWQCLALWIALMVVISILYGFPDLGWLLGSAWSCLLVSGALILIWEKISSTSHDVEEPPALRRPLLADGDFKKAMADALARARANKGTDLSSTEISRLEKLVADCIRLERAVKEQEAKDEALEDQRLRDAAEVVVKREVEKAQMEAKSEERTKAIAEERAKIKDRLRELGYNVKDDPES